MLCNLHILMLHLLPIPWLFMNDLKLYQIETKHQVKVEVIDAYFIRMKSNLIHDPRMHLLHIPKCSIQNRNVYISVTNGALWDMWNWSIEMILSTNPCDHH